MFESFDTGSPEISDVMPLYIAEYQCVQYVFGACLNTSVCETTDKRNQFLVCKQWCFAKEIPFLSTDV